MKIMIALFSMSLSVFAFADGGACDKFLPCGVYEGPGADYDAAGSPTGGKFVERLTFTNVDANTIHVQELMWDPATQQPGDRYALDVDFVFQENGLYTANYKGQLFATGVCRESVCTFNFVPWKHSRGVTGNVHILRFENGKLMRSMMVSTHYEEPSYQRSELTKK